MVVATRRRPLSMSPLEQLRSDCLLYVPCYRLDGNPFSSRDIFRRRFQAEARWVLPTGGSGVNWDNIPLAYDGNFISGAGWNGVAATSYNIHWQALKNESAWVYDDKGAGYFGSNWVHSIDVNLKEGYSRDCSGMVHLLSNDVDNAYNLYTNSKTYVGLKVTNDGKLFLEESYLGAQYTSAQFSMALGTWYYLTITKAGDALSCNIYSDAARTTLLATISLTLQADHTFRYIFAVNTYPDWMPVPYRLENLHVANLDLGSGPEDFLTYTEEDPNSHIKFYGGYSPPLVLTFDAAVVCDKIRPEAGVAVAQGMAYIDFEYRKTSDGSWHRPFGFPKVHDFGAGGGKMFFGDAVYNLGAPVSINGVRWTMGYPGVETLAVTGPKESWLWKVGGQPYWTPRGRYFDGVSKWYIDCGDVANLPSDDGATMIAIVDALSSSVDQTIFWKGDKNVTLTGLGLAIVSAQNCFSGIVVGSEHNSFEIDTPIVLNKFVHLGLTVDFRRGKIALFLEGNRVGEIDYTDSGKWVNTNPLTIGYNPDMDVDFNGYMKAAWAYRRPLTPVEMMAHCRSTKEWAY